MGKRSALEFTFGSFSLCWLDKKLYNFVILALSARNKKKVKVIITKINLFYPKQNVTPFCAGFGTEYPNIYL